EDVRIAIEHYLEHRGSDKLSRAAEASLDELEAALQAEDIDEDAAYDRFGAARFGFAAALDRWGENQRARDGLARATERMIDYEIERDRPQAAATLLAGLAGIIEAPAASKVRIEAARRNRESALEHAALVARERDPKIGQRTRLFVGAIFGTAWWIIPLVRGIQGVDPRTESYEQLLWIAYAFFGVAVVFYYWARESMRKTAINRGTMATLLVFLVSQILFGLIAQYAEITMLQLQPLLMVLYAFATASMAIFVDRRFALPAFAFALGAGLVLLWPLQRNW